MQQRLKIIVVVKQTPLFKIFQHILSARPEVGVVQHVRSWASLQTGIKSGRITRPDVLLLDLNADEQALVVDKLRRCWPQARLVMLTCDRQLATRRALAFDAVLVKNAIVRELLPCLRRVAPVIDESRAVTAMDALAVRGARANAQTPVNYHFPAVSLPNKTEQKDKKCALVPHLSSGTNKLSEE